MSIQKSRTAVNKKANKAGGEPIIRDVGDKALLIELGKTPTLSLTERVIAVRRNILDANIAGVESAISGFGSVMITYHPSLIRADDLKRRLIPIIGHTKGRRIKGRSLGIPVCYEAELGLDLDAIEAETGMTREEIISLHADASYTVLLMGFLPGFPYLGGLPKALKLPRRNTPRTRIPEGAVAIAEQFSAIYPTVSPGGWHILGQTPLILFDEKRDPPSLLQPGDRLTFRAVTKAEHDRFARLDTGDAWRIALNGWKV